MPAEAFWVTSVVGFAVPPIPAGAGAAADGVTTCTAGVKEITGAPASGVEVGRDIGSSGVRA